MIITIDRAGRVVLPKSIRDRFHLLPGTEIELTTDLESIKLSLRDSKPALALKDGILVHTASDAPPLDIDIAAFIAQGREARGQDLAGR
ncbi:MAG: AbrB/MazE/SpoVT family DNA-binding domain-containing protein [Burkholderiales bacterium]|nr:AbrB/MazE/SpoVT family DNA-binding domain-containing protein [Opitutaceae bacterium]